MEQQGRGISGEIGKFTGDADADFTPLRMIAVGESKEAMQRAVTERDNPFS
jgi:hypothetical protein